MKQLRFSFNGSPSPDEYSLFSISFCKLGHIETITYALWINHILLLRVYELELFVVQMTFMDLKILCVTKQDMYRHVFTYAHISSPFIPVYLIRYFYKVGHMLIFCCFIINLVSKFISFNLFFFIPGNLKMKKERPTNEVIIDSLLFHKVNV